ncbi:hypothetical protein NIES4073_22960 [Kalymmatonema gypsitolerans NIES-4073]|nr:hypothetical protein NIES4073_22960 [Scytonema sp. NIES-4073]
MITENITDAIACPKFSGISGEIDERFLRVKEWYEFINEQQLKFGQYLAELKAETKRQYVRGLESVGLVKTQLNKFIKAAEIADNLPSKLSPKLGLYVLLQLGQKRNGDAVEHLTENDTQLSAAQKIKQHQKPPQPKMPKPVMGWERNREGSRTLVLRLTDGDTALAIESGYKKSGLPLPLYLSNLIRQHEEVPQSWQGAQEELAQYMDTQSEEIQSLLSQIRQANELINRLPNPKDATEIMMLRTAREEREKAEEILGALYF